MASRAVPHLMTLADLSVPQIQRLLTHSKHLKELSLPLLLPQGSFTQQPIYKLQRPYRTLSDKTIALLFSKRSTRTRLSAETSATLLGGRALFLGKDDIQLGVNESPRDTARVIGGQCQGIFARVGEHEEIEELAKYSPVPVLNALSSLWHPTQILADLLTLYEHAHLFAPESSTAAKEESSAEPSNAEPQSRSKPKSKKDKYKKDKPKPTSLPELRPLTVAYVGDSANVLHDMLVTFPRLGHTLRVASPEQYRAPAPVWDRVVELGCDKGIWWGADPKEAVHGADVVVTDTWISMGQEAEKEARLAAFKGYQVTEKLCQEGGANPNWKFMHCLPRKEHEVDDEVFYGPRSLVFPEADNRKWTIMAAFDLLFGKWDLSPSSAPPVNTEKQEK